MNKRANLPYSTQDLYPQAEQLLRRNSFSSYKSSDSRFKTFKRLVHRLFKPTTLDFETAIWEIFHLIINPKKMYKTHYYYKQSTGNYTRDDPSFLILLTSFLSVSAIAWGLAYSPYFVDIVKLILYMVVIDFYLTGFVISTVLWFIINRLFNSRSSSGLNYVEWGFCFDIHCNSFLIIWCLLYIVQFLLLPVLRIKESIFALFLGNSLYFGSVGYYFLITLYGFNSLPFVTSTGINNYTNSENPARLLQLIIVTGILPALVIGWLISLGLGFNVAETMVKTYFS